MKKLLFLVILLLFPFFCLFMLLMGIVMTISGDSDTTLDDSVFESGSTNSTYTFKSGVSPQIERYRPYFEKYAEKYGIEEYVDVLMAMAMQESGGRMLDVMQSSESLGLPVNAIVDPEESIEQGVKYFSEVLSYADGDLELALQSYNMGLGFVDYAKKYNDGEYSKDLVQDFSEMWKQRLGWNRYGDVNYVDNVMRYVEIEETEFIEADDDWALPLEDIRITSEFGWRTHPVTGEKKSFHGGLDFACTPSDSIMSVADGKVVQAIHDNVGYGSYVTVQHGPSEYSRYAHLSSINVSKGDVVKQGDNLGNCGTTGTSTGYHLHLEHLTDLNQSHQEKKDPKETLGL